MVRSPFDRLTDRICAFLASQGLDAGGWRIHCLPTGVWGASDAAEGGLAELLSAIASDGDMPARSRPLLVLGLLPPAEVRRRVKGIPDRRQHLLLDWPGLAYLHYGIDKEVLLATAHRIVAGALTPLPEGIWPAVPDILRLTSEVRHWLENRRRNIGGARRDFESAARGEIVLDQAYFEPVEAISEAHRAMLGRLWAMEASALCYAPRIGGLAKIRDAIEVFETRWRELELVRAVLRQAEADSSASHLTAAAEAHQLVVEALSDAIRLTHELDNEMTADRED